MSKKIIIPFAIVVAIVIVSFLLFNTLESYFTTLLNDVSKHRGTYSGISMLVLAFDIVLPVPSSIVMYMNGYVLGMGYGSLTSLTALMVSSLAGYYIGKFTSFSIRSEHDERANSILTRYGMVAVLLSRGIPVLSESVCVVCGYNGMPLQKYLLLNLAGYAPLCMLYAFCGSQGYDQGIFLLSLGCSLGISAAFWYGRSMISKKHEKPAAA
ncbi:TVP38/TMEM64 family protein [Hufsiella ginkgonis]|uniref:VTT domain-containing protein n=1 Tax=Hufsiella ginkgonis TaxID=2695274 RepID=A0A7K1XXC4_9SPHI|nr:VTT domain-containing protein [Hufsiella ginkgonis]MXV15661.1 hypothetical protein [Hufsiella ginkgonis]